MTLDQIILYPLTHRVVTEAMIESYATAMAAMVSRLASAPALLPAPVKANARRTGGRKAKR